MTTTTTIPNISTGEGTNPLKALLSYGQSPWMDYIRKDLLTGGGLKKYIDNDGLRGMTSNPAIFEKAITGSNLYNDVLTSPEAKKLAAASYYVIRAMQFTLPIGLPRLLASRSVPLEVRPEFCAVFCRRQFLAAQLQGRAPQALVPAPASRVCGTRLRCCSACSRSMHRLRRGRAGEVRARAPGSRAPPPDGLAPRSCRRGC